jgi:ribosome biogenesis GTPase
METGELSGKIGRGKNTTRHSQLNYVTNGTYLCDTPGFSSLFLPDIAADELRFMYPEFSPYEGKCRFPDCVHRKEPDCAVKEAVEAGHIVRERYDNYTLLYEELAAKRKW